jgi:hypothetical protein
MWALFMLLLRGPPPIGPKDPSIIRYTTRHTTYTSKPFMIKEKKYKKYKIFLRGALLVPQFKEHWRMIEVTNASFGHREDLAEHKEISSNLI